MDCYEIHLRVLNTLRTGAFKLLKCMFLGSKQFNLPVLLKSTTHSYGHNDPVCWGVDNCDKKTRNIFFTKFIT